MTHIPIRPHAYRYRAVIEWIDPETGEPGRYEGEFFEISVGRAGRLMSTMTNGVSLNFPSSKSLTIEQIAPVTPA